MFVNIPENKARKSLVKSIYYVILYLQTKKKEKRNLSEKESLITFTFICMNVDCAICNSELTINHNF